MKNFIVTGGMLIASCQIAGCALVGFGTGTVIDGKAKTDMMSGDQLDASVVGKTVYLYEGNRESKGVAVEWTPEYTVIMNKQGEKTQIENSPETTLKLKRPSSTGRILLTSLGLAWDIAAVITQPLFTWDGEWDWNSTGSSGR